MTEIDDLLERSAIATRQRFADLRVSPVGAIKRRAHRRRATRLAGAITLVSAAAGIVAVTANDSNRSVGNSADRPTMPAPITVAPSNTPVVSCAPELPSQPSGTPDVTDTTAVSYTVTDPRWTYGTAERGPDVTGLVFYHAASFVSIETGPPAQVLPIPGSPAVAALTNESTVMVFGRSVILRSDSVGMNHQIAWIMPTGNTVSIQFGSVTTSDVLHDLRTLRPLTSDQLDEFTAPSPGC